MHTTQVVSLDADLRQFRKRVANLSRKRQLVVAHRRKSYEKTAIRRKKSYFRLWIQLRLAKA
jgi:hypothetical protein